MPKDKMNDIYENLNRLSIESSKKLYPLIQPAPCVGNIPIEKIQSAVASVSEAKQAGKKVMEKYAKAIKNLGDK